MAVRNEPRHLSLPAPTRALCIGAWEKLGVKDAPRRSSHCVRADRASRGSMEIAAFCENTFSTASSEVHLFLVIVS